MTMATEAGTLSALWASTSPAADTTQGAAPPPPGGAGGKKAEHMEEHNLINQPFIVTRKPYCPVNTISYPPSTPADQVHLHHPCRILFPSQLWDHLSSSAALLTVQVTITSHQVILHHHHPLTHTWGLLLFFENSFESCMMLGQTPCMCDEGCPACFYES